MGFIHDEVEKAGFEVDWFCADDLPPRWQGRLSRYAFPWLLRSYLIRKYREGVRYAWINVHEQCAVGLVFNREAFGSPRVALTSHGAEERGWALALKDHREGKQPLKLFTRIVFPLVFLNAIRLSHRQADHVFCLNQEDRRFFQERYHRASSSITHMSPGAGEAFGRDASTRDYNRMERVLFSGTWRRNKGVEYLAEAMKCVMSAFPSIEFSVLGGGVSASEIRDRFPEDLRHRVTVIQVSDDAGSAEVYASHDLFVLPSLFEGTPLTLIESMWSGLPITTTSTCGMRDVIEHDVDGLLVEPGMKDPLENAIRRLIEDSGLRRRLGKAAREKAEKKYSWSKVAETVVRAYQEA